MQIQKQPQQKDLYYRGSVIKTQHEDYACLDGNCEKLVDVIIDRYGKWDQTSLYTITSQEGTAWSRARIKGIGTKMSDESIMSDFKKLLK